MFKSFVWSINKVSPPANFKELEPNKGFSVSCLAGPVFVIAWAFTEISSIASVLSVLSLWIFNSTSPQLGSFAGIGSAISNIEVGFEKHVVYNALFVILRSCKYPLK